MSRRRYFNGRLWKYMKNMIEVVEDSHIEKVIILLFKKT